MRFSSEPASSIFGESARAVAGAFFLFEIPLLLGVFAMGSPLVQSRGARSLRIGPRELSEKSMIVVNNALPAAPT
jgi:hypothetical protein